MITVDDGYCVCYNIGRNADYRAHLGPPRPPPPPRLAQAGARARQQDRSPRGRKGAQAQGNRKASDAHPRGAGAQGRKSTQKGRGNAATIQLERALQEERRVEQANSKLAQSLRRDLSVGLSSRQAEML